MGESKRRKKLDPSYGRSTQKIKKINGITINLKPDFGEQFRHAITKEHNGYVTLFIGNPQSVDIRSTFVETVNGVRSYHCFASINGALMSFFYPVNLAAKEGIAPVFTLQLRVDDRYRTKNTGEWVTPFHFVCTGKHDDSSVMFSLS